MTCPILHTPLALIQRHQLQAILPEWTALCLHGATGVRALFHVVVVFALLTERFLLSLHLTVRHALHCTTLILVTRMLALSLSTAESLSGVVGMRALEHAAAVTPSEPVL